MIINGLPESIEFKEFNGIKYLSISDLSELLNKNSNFNEYSINFNNEKLKFAPGSFFVVYENENNLRAAQMNLPCAEIANILYIPFYTFLNAMSGIGLISFSTDSYKNLNIKTSIFKGVIVLKNERKYPDIQPPFNDSLNVNKKYQKSNSKKIITKDTSNLKIIESKDSIINPSKYSIPTKLIK